MAATAIQANELAVCEVCTAISVCQSQLDHNRSMNPGTSAVDALEVMLVLECSL